MEGNDMSTIIEDIEALLTPKTTATQAIEAIRKIRVMCEAEKKAKKGAK
jgi:hypothetical protein